MKSGTLSRMFSFATKSGKRVQIDTLRFVSMHEKEKGAIHYAIHALDSDITVELKSRLDGNVKNTDSNYDEMFWSKVSLSCDDEAAYITLKTKKTEFIVSTAKTDSVKVGNVPLCAIKAHTDGSLLVEHIYHSRLKPDETLTLEKYFSVVTSRDHPKSELNNRAVENALKAKAAGFDQLLKDHKRAWAAIWAHSDIEIKGDDASQQGIRFNIFHLNQTYTGRDNRLNIGPKGFTGEKYGGGTYWDTEVFCLPFFLSTRRKRSRKIPSYLPV